MPRSDRMRLTAFTVSPEARWDVTCLVAPFPARWLAAVQKAYLAQPRTRAERSFPTQGLTALLIGLDPAVLHVRPDLRDPHFITAFPGVDTTVIAAAVAAWADTRIAKGPRTPDWWDLCRPEDLVLTESAIDLLDRQVHPNGTSAPADTFFKLLPTFLAQRVVHGRMPLLGRDRAWIMGPPQEDGRRAAVLWPPDTVEDPRRGRGLATVKIDFHTQTVPNHPHPHVHADLSVSRFPLAPVTYVPARGRGPARASIWLHAPDSFLRENEPHTLLSATAEQVRTRVNGTDVRQWRWDSGLARVLSRLTHLPFPDPDKTLMAPETAAREGSIQAFVVHSEGSKSLDDDAHDPGRSRSVRHVAKNGLVPDDHLEVHENLAGLFARHGIEMIDPLPRQGPRNTRRLTIREHPGRIYTLELWTQSSVTREALLTALEHEHDLTPSVDTADTSLIHFSGTTNIDVVLRDAGDLGAGIEQADGDANARLRLVEDHVERVTGRLGISPGPRAAILELDDDSHFARARKIDPKKALKKAFARTDRRLQCLRPARNFVPPAEPSRRKVPPTPYPGTQLDRGSVHRASAAVADALRQLGRLGAYETPSEVPDLEQIGIWLHHEGNVCIPLAVRLRPDGEATVSLAATDGEPSETFPYQDLPKALVEGRGRIPQKNQKNRIARFLTRTLGIDDGGAAQDTHDRLVFVRAASFRNWGWDWMQDRHVRPDRMVLPGADLKDPLSAPRWLSPGEFPGLRIVRVRERSSDHQVALGFSDDHKTANVRTSGLFRFAPRVFYSINRRPDQMQTPLKKTKLNPDLLSHYTAQAGNPGPLEITPVFLQPQDDPAAFALFTGQLRRGYLHTDQATRFPSVLHLGELADEYL